MLKLGNTGINQQALAQLKMIILILLWLLVSTIKEITSVDRRLLVYLLWLGVDKALCLTSLIDNRVILLLVVDFTSVFYLQGLLL